MCNFLFRFCVSELCMVGKLSQWFFRLCLFSFFFQAEDGIRDLVRSRGLGDVYKRQGFTLAGLLSLLY